MGVCVHSIPLFIVFEINEHGDFPHEKKTRTNREHVLSRRKKKVIVETTQTQKVRKPQQRDY